MLPLENRLLFVDVLQAGVEAPLSLVWWFGTTLFQIRFKGETRMQGYCTKRAANDCANYAF